ncbi:MAG: PrsW family intramembrane metalloprotease [Anaerolineae bacterium]|nr:PrsW family intramembrane metalloprotease [Anaerolineae bacterium]
MTCVLGAVLSVGITIAPPLVAMVVLWWLDRYEKEPLLLLSIVLLWGAVPTIGMSIVAQLLLNLPLSDLLGSSILYQATSLSLIAPLTEETFKGIILLAIHVFYRDEFDGVMDGILYGAMVGFGFSIVETSLYLVGSLHEGGWAAWQLTAALRVGLYSLNHALFAACTGIGLGLARNSRAGWQRLLFPILGWGAAMALHGIHNGGTLLAEDTAGLSCLVGTVVDWMGAAAMLLLVVVATQREQRWFAALAPEVAAGTISAQEHEIAAHYGTRVAQGWHVLTAHGLRAWFAWSRHVQAIVDLAYARHRQGIGIDGSVAERRIAALRQRIATGRSRLEDMERKT